MDKLNWCCKQKKGIELIEPNTNLCKEYFEKAENALKAVKSLEGNNEWQISSAYYSMYFSLYAILMKIGIKSEIHICSIELMNTILISYFSNEDYNLLKKSFKARNDTQYYTDRFVSDEQRIKMINKASKIYLKCNEISVNLNPNKIEIIRENLKKVLKR